MKDREPIGKAEMETHLKLLEGLKELSQITAALLEAVEVITAEKEREKGTPK